MLHHRFFLLFGAPWGTVARRMWDRAQEPLSKRLNDRLTTGREARVSGASGEPVRGWDAKLTLAGIAGALLCVALSGCAAGSTTSQVSHDASASTPAPTTATTADLPASRSGSAAALVSRLRVAPEGSMAGYDRALFGTWADADGDGCDTRAEVLLRQSRVPPQVDPFGCAVVAGEWLSSYDGHTTDDPAELDIDHVVALAEAWRSGAAAWDAGRRQALANDLDRPGELVAVTSAANRSKGDRDPASWRPPNRASRCEFGIGWVRTKLKWRLTADEAEVRALRDMLHGCSA